MTNAAKPLIWSIKNPTAEDFQWWMWRPDKTARPYVFMFYDGTWRFGSEQRITPTTGEWAGPLPMPEDGE